MSELFTKELLLNRNFLPNQLVPLTFQLEFIDSTKVEVGDYLTIESVVVYFVKDYDVPMMTQRRNDHLVMMGLYWPDNFPLIDGARVVINVNYNYHRNNSILFTKLVTHEVAIATGDTSQILAERRKLRDSTKIHREAYDNDTRLLGSVFTATNGETWEVIFNGKSIMRFTCNFALRTSFNIERLARWSSTQEINEFIFYKKTWFGKKRRIQLTIPYDPTKKYLLIIRKPKGNRNDSFYVEWTNTDPQTIGFKDIYPEFKPPKKK